jgi:ABC-type phosphate/phosphonate transport system ATPase subunit
LRTGELFVQHNLLEQVEALAAVLLGPTGTDPASRSTWR